MPVSAFDRSGHSSLATASDTQTRRSTCQVSQHKTFWTFTGSQTVFKGPDGRPAIPGSAWDEYVAWLREERLAPSEHGDNESRMTPANWALDLALGETAVT